MSLRFVLRSLVFQIVEVFHFFMGYNGEFEIFEKKIVKNWKLEISKIQNSTFVRTTEETIQESRGSSALKFWLP